MTIPNRVKTVLIAVALGLVAGCGGRGSSTAVVPERAMTPTVRSVSPGSVAAPPMAQGKDPAAASMERLRPQAAIQPLGWTQLSGAAVFVAASPDGSIWVLSPQGPGGSSDRYIYHYANGNWTNIPGWATRLAVGPDNTLWAVNAVGGIYYYNASGWHTFTGGASDISVGPDGSVYVISNAAGSPDGRGIWHYTTSAGWVQMAGAAVRIAASADGGSYQGGAIGAGGYWVTNAYGSIYYYNPSSGYHPYSGAALEVQPTKNGGIFVLGSPPAQPRGNPIYYNDLSTGNWTQQPGAGVSLATDGTNYVYAVGVEGGIYRSALSAGSAVPSAPQVGLLAQTSTGSFAGVLSNVSTGATVVAISTDELVSSSSTTLTTDQINFALGSSTLSAVRAPDASARAVPNEPFARHERPVSGPEEFQALLAKLRPASPAETRAAQSVRRTSSLPTSVGSTTAFWLDNGAIGTIGSSSIQRNGTLRASTAHGYIWVDTSLAGTVTDTAVQSIANDFENAYASDSQHYGTSAYSATSPGMLRNGSPAYYTACDANGNPTGGAVPIFITPTDNKTHVFVVDSVALGSGVGGYFSSTNFIYQAALNCELTQGYTQSTLPRSNEAPMFVVEYNTNDSSSYALSEDLVRGTAHEYQHEINFVNHVLLSGGSSEATWINEGMSMLAQDFAVSRMFPSLPHDTADALRHAQQYLAAPQNFSLTAFSGIDAGGSSPKYNCSGCYGTSYLFQRYLYDRFGGDAYLHAMLGYNTRHWALQIATGEAEAQLFSEFPVAMAASGTGATSDPRFTIGSLNLRASYADQFGRYYTPGAPATTSLQSVEYPFNGSFAYYALGASAYGQTLSARDVGGQFGLAVGIVQQ